MKKSQRNLVLYAICAITWTIITIISIVDKSYNDSMFLFGINTLCAVLWILVFIAELKKNKSK